MTEQNNPPPEKSAKQTTAITPLSSVRIVLLQTYHPGNIGAAARAMKTMGLADLALVRPKRFPDDKATSRAAGAADLLENALVVDTLEQAISDCTQVFATSSRKPFAYSRPQQSCQQMVSWYQQNPAEKIAIVFGRERMGMSSEDINLCDQMIYIPGNPEYDVLNMASAVQIVCYELFRQLNQSELNFKQNTQASYATHLELENFYRHLESTLTEIEFLRRDPPSQTMQRLRQMISRSGPSAQEISLLRGMLSSIDKKI